MEGKPERFISLIIKLKHMVSAAIYRYIQIVYHYISKGYSEIYVPRKLLYIYFVCIYITLQEKNCFALGGHSTLS